MKLRSKLYAAAAIGLLGSAPAWSIPIDTVGSIDTVLASTSLANSGEETETSWVSSVLGFAVEFDGKTSCPKVGCAWESVEGTPYSDVYAFGLLDSPAYFLIKTGAGSSVGPGHTHFLFENIGNLVYAVLRMSQLGFGADITITKISHITEFESGTTVPEPGTLAMLGLGLLGMGLGVGRAKRHKS